MNNRTLGISMIAIATSIALWGEASALRVEVQAPPSTAPAPTTVQEVPAIWPPQLGKPYPELTLSNYDGTQVKLSDFKGKVVIIEPIECPIPILRSLGKAVTCADRRPSRSCAMISPVALALAAATTWAESA